MWGEGGGRWQCCLAQPLGQESASVGDAGEDEALPDPGPHRGCHALRLSRPRHAQRRRQVGANFQSWARDNCLASRQQQSDSVTKLQRQEKIRKL